MDIKNFLQKNKLIVGTLVVSIVVGLASGLSMPTKKEYQVCCDNKHALEEKYASLENDVSEYQLELDMLTAEKIRLAEEKAEQDRLAEEKAEQDRLAAIAPTNNNQSSSNASSGGADNTQQNMVWVSRTGTKYHSKSNCGSMSSATQVTLDAAKSQGREACSRC